MYNASYLLDIFQVSWRLANTNNSIPFTILSNLWIVLWVIKIITGHYVSIPIMKLTALVSTYNSVQVFIVCTISVLKGNVWICNFVMHHMNRPLHPLPLTVGAGELDIIETNQIMVRHNTVLHRQSGGIDDDAMAWKRFTHCWLFCKQSGRSPKVVALFLLQTLVAIWYDYFNCMIQSKRSHIIGTKFSSIHLTKWEKCLVFRLSFVNLQRAKDGTHMFDAKYRYVFVV